MKEKIKILSNEIEILRHEIFSKDKELAVNFHLNRKISRKIAQSMLSVIH